MTRRQFKSGDKINSFEVIGYEPDPNSIDKKRKNKIKVKCICGEIRYYLATQLKSIKECKKCFALKYMGKNHSSYTGGEYVHGFYFAKIRAAAKSKNREFLICVTYIDNLLVKQQFKCALTGVPIKTGSKYQEITASLDRIDSDIGYIEGNVQWVHKTVNWMKNWLSQKEFIEWCNRVYNHSNNLNLIEIDYVI